MPEEKAYVSSSSFPPLTQGKLRVYSMRFCPYAERTLLVLAHKEIEHETVNINLSDKPSWFWDRNPNGTVPIIEQDEKVLYESLVTCDYLDEVYPQNKLTPSDPYRRALDKLMIDTFSKVVTCYYKFYRVSDDHTEDIKNFLAALDKLEKAFEKRSGTFIGGEKVQMVDLMMWPHSERFEAACEVAGDMKITTDRYPKFTKWREAMVHVPAVEKCRYDTPSHVHFIQSVRAKKPDYDYGL